MRVLRAVEQTGILDWGGGGGSDAVFLELINKNEILKAYRYEEWNK
jgi:hypothetical protein